MRKRLGAMVFLSAFLLSGQNPEQSTQQPQPGGGTTTPGPAPTRPSPSPIPAPAPAPEQRDRERTPGGERERSRLPGAERDRPVVISGRVMMDDGAPPPDRVVIECINAGVVRPETYTDSKGRFSFQLGQNNYMVPDARFGGRAESAPAGTVSSDRGGLGPLGRYRTACSELRASVPGYRSSVAVITGRQGFYVDVGAIVLRRLARVEGTTISVTSLEAPKEAKKAYEKGLKAIETEKWEAGRKEFAKAVAAFPRYAAAWYELGRCLERQRKLGEARAAYEKALEADAKYLSPQVRLAGLAAGERNWREVSDITAHVVKLNSAEFPEAFFLNAAANYNLRNLDLAEKSARAAVSLDDQHQFPRAHQLLGLILAAKGDFAAASLQMKRYLELAPDAPDAGAVRSRLAELETRLRAAVEKP